MKDGYRPVKCLRNADEIAEYIGENSKCVNQLVADESLPAWKRNGCGPWRSLDVLLDQWLLNQAGKYCPHAKRDAGFEKK